MEAGEAAGRAGARVRLRAAGPAGGPGHGGRGRQRGSGPAPRRRWDAPALRNPAGGRRGGPRPGAQVAPAAAPVCPRTAAQSRAAPCRLGAHSAHPDGLSASPPMRTAGPGGGTHQFSCIHWMAACSLNCFSNSYSCKVNTDMFIGAVAAEPLRAPKCCLPPPREPGPCAPAAGEPPPLAWPAPPQRYPGFSIAPLPSAPLLPGPPVSSSSAAAAQRPGAARS